MPSPSSETSTRASPSSAPTRTRTRTRPPSDENFTALSKRLQTTCIRRVRSPLTWRCDVPSVSTSSATERSTARVRQGSAPPPPRPPGLARRAHDTELARKYRGDVEKVVEEARERLGVLLDDTQAALDLVRRGPERENHVHPAEDGRQGRAQLVRERGEKLVLGEVNLFRRAACAPVALKQAVWPDLRAL